MSHPDPDQHDPLGSSLHLLRLEGTFYSRGELTAPWSISVPRDNGLLNFLVVTSGRCWLVVDGEPPLLMERSSLALIPHGTPHRVCSDPDLPAVPLADIPVDRVSDRLEVMRHGGGGEVTRTMYGCVRFDHVAAQHLLRHLPPVIRIHSWEDGADSWLQSTLQFIADEATGMRPGGETILTRLADVLVIQALRAWLASTNAETGWLAALRDPQIGRALSIIHADPGAPVSLVALARAVGMSRSAFAARFAALVGQPPMAYAAQWRLTTARARIAQTSDPLAVIAAEAGYRSEPAFCRAFKRHFGVPPGRLRNRPDSASVLFGVAGPALL
ncbi:AraC family transcriptional regulator [Aestuariicoccus sp. MJ-SS9]|uniref:AraC family transcriptional regulator n=1 Tax=Aestuariicoccus sp. MJ-SS9 TaxID=3079855 RepID=UPI00290DCB05|nr:AraC family transcriptional regulator [Aestuariicoccus sp. MJ-SS9]MDU8913153.1 AraC family transcriptional regulator [Aestuariicoccus sp. MJ-SS9]